MFVKHCIKIVIAMLSMALVAMAPIGCGSGEKTITSADALLEFLNSQPANSPDEPIRVAMKVNENMIQSVVEVIHRAGKYVSLNLTDSPLTVIPENAFRNSKNIVGITIPNSVTAIRGNAFSGSGIKEITVPSSVIGVGENAFMGLQIINVPFVNQAIADIAWGTHWREYLDEATINYSTRGLNFDSLIAFEASKLSVSTRAGDYGMYDLAYNILQSSEPNGIIFINGYNLTFSLLVLQKVHGIRKDVRVINLRFANYAWYNQQLRKIEPRVPMHFTEEQLDELEPEHNRLREQRQFNMHQAGITIMLPSFEERNVIRVSDRMVLNITDAAAWDHPVYFAWTVSEDNYMGLGPFLQNEGLVSRVVRTPPTGRDRVNIDRILELAESVFLMRGIGDTANNEIAKSLMVSYLQIAVDLRAPLRVARSDLQTVRGIAKATGLDTTNRVVMERVEEARVLLPIVEPQHEQRVERAIRYMERLVEKMHWDWRARAILSDFLIDHGRGNDAIALLEKSLAGDRDNRLQYELLLEQARMTIEKEN